MLHLLSLSFALQLTALLAAEIPSSIQVEVAPAPATPLWSKKLPGYVTDLAVSKDGKAVFFSTIPDYEREGAQRDFRVWRFNAAGKQVWMKKTETQVRSLSISEDGALSVYTDYAENIVALDAAGRVKWTAHGACRPSVLAPLKRVICYHDDDAEPRTAYQLLDIRNGKRLTNQEVSATGKGDILSLKTAPDRTALVMGIEEDGSIRVVSQTVVKGVLKNQIDQKWDGKIIDVAIGKGPAYDVAVLWNTSGSKPKLRVSRISSDGKRVDASLDGRATQVEIAPETAQIFVYSNGLDGQVVRAFGGDLALAEVWKQGHPKTTDFSAGMFITDRWVVQGLEDIADTGRISRYRAFTFDGKPAWDLPVKTDAGSYLYTQAFAPKAGRLIVGTDDANLSAYRIK